MKNKYTKRRIKRELKTLYDTPEPIRREAFLKELSPVCPVVSTRKFMCRQLFYIRKWEWILSTAIVVSAAGIVTRAEFLGGNKLGLLSAVMPYLALTVLAESARSDVYGMSELEFATRFSLKSVLLARMGGLAALHGIILFVLSLCLGGVFLPVACEACYILTPYFMTVCTGIHLLRRHHGKEEAYICVCVPVFVSLSLIVLRQAAPFFYGMRYLGWWLAALALTALFTVRECVLYFGGLECRS